MHVFRKACLEASLGYPAVYPRELIEGRSNACLGETLRCLYLGCTSPRVAVTRISTHVLGTVTMSVSRLHQSTSVAVTSVVRFLGKRYDVCI